jgi:predicted Zn finger-like uncharacterized protein
VKFLCDKCKAKYQIADEKVVGRTVRMKCRRCGHRIEVRAEVTETSVATKLPKAPAPAAGAPRQKPAPGADESITQTKLPAEAARPIPEAPQPGQPVRATQPTAPLGSLAGAFRSAVEHEEEPSSPLDMEDLRAADEWYVAINGVPVGPILVAEVRRKAALGSVTEDSLVWQDGLEEWRPVRSFPELSGIVREAAHAGRGSLIPPAPPSRGTARLPPEHAPAPSPQRAPPHPAAPAPQPPASSPRPLAPAPHPLAPAPHPTATGLMNATEQAVALSPANATASAPRPAEARPTPVVTDPFKAPPPAFAPPQPNSREAGLGLIAPSFFDNAALRATAEPQVRPSRGTPWIAIAMVAAATAFGAMSAVVVWLPRTTTPPQPESVHPPAGSGIAQVAGNPAPAVVAPSDRNGSLRDTPLPSAVAAPAHRAVASAPARPNPVATASASAPSRALETRAVLPPSIGAIPTDDTTESPRAPGQCQSEGQVQQVIAQHQTAIRRTCWERSQTEKPAASVAVALTIAPDGSPQGVSVTGDDPTVTKCIEDDLHSWHFPAMGCSQKTAFSLKFVRQ